MNVPTAVGLPELCRCSGDEEQVGASFDSTGYDVILHGMYWFECVSWEGLRNGGDVGWWMN